MQEINQDDLWIESTDNIPDTAMTDNISAATGNRTVTSCAGGAEYLIKSEGDNPGIYYCKTIQDRVIEVFLCALITVLAYFRGTGNTGWGRFISFQDPDGQEHQLDMYAADCGKDTDPIAELRSRGLVITANKQHHAYIIDYILHTPPQNSRRIRSTEKTGWYNSNLYVAQDTVIGVSDETIVYTGKSHQHPFSVKGTLEGWQQTIARYCLKNPLLTMVLCMPFAAPLLYLLGFENGGFNLVGESSIGKSTAMKLASSIIGRPTQVIQRWNATANAMEGIAAAYNDCFLPLDEIAQASGSEIGNTIYMVGNGMGKGRMSSNATLRNRTTFRCLVLSNGERYLEQHMAESGKAVRAGQEVRLVDIPADMGMGYGIYSDLHNFENSYQLNEELVTNTDQYYGTPFLTYMEHLVQADDDTVESFHKFITDFVDATVPEDASGQVKRIAQRFALLACAGEYATTCGVTGWEPGTASEAVIEMFQRWLDDRGTTGRSEENKLISQVRRFFEQHGDSRFAPMKKSDFGTRAVINRVGFMQSGRNTETLFYVLPESFKTICEGFNPKQAVRTLLASKLLKPNKDGHGMHSVRLPDFDKPKKVYIFTSSVLDDYKEETPAIPEPTEE